MSRTRGSLWSFGLGAWLLLCGSAHGWLVQGSGSTAKPEPDQELQDFREAAPPTSTAKPADRSKADTGVDIDAKLKAKKKKEDVKPDLEIRAVRSSPSDTITYFKPNHWTLFHLDLIANNRDETVELRTGYELVPDSPHAVQFRRLTHLIKEQNRLSRLPVFLPLLRKEKSIELGLYYRDRTLPIQPPGLERQPCTRLGPDQFLIVALSDNPDNYRFLSGMQCILPGLEADDDEPNDRRRYYFLVTPFQPRRPLVADTMLGWTSTSHVIWDDLDPGLLSVRQQEAMIDWLHWGGQLIISGGAAATKLEQSFLAEYLPADVTGSTEVSDLTDLSQRYLSVRTFQHPQPQVKPISISPNRPVYLAKLAPRPGSEPLTARDLIGEFPLLAERRVGRGRVVMAAFSLYQPELVSGWKEAYDRFWRERLLKADETLPNASFVLGGSVSRTYTRLPSRKLSQFRLLCRDLGAAPRRLMALQADSQSSPDEIPGANLFPRDSELVEVDSVAEWRDATPVPSTARLTLLDVTGIKIPDSHFVLAASLSYVVILVPLNWLLCRFGFRRAELAWLLFPVIILAFSIGIIRYARVNVGYNSSRNEIDVVEMFEGYPRGHITRFLCMYSGSRERCQFRSDLADTLMLPMSAGDVQRGHRIERMNMDWELTEGYPAALGRYEIHPRSIGMVRAEEVRTLGGPIQIQGGNSPTRRRIANETGWELWDCHLITARGRIPIGDLRRGESTEIDLELGTPDPTDQRSGDAYKVHRTMIPDGEMAGHSEVPELGVLSPLPMLSLLEAPVLNIGQSDSARGARLVGWAPRIMPGMDLDPSPDKSNGLTIFVVHLDGL